MSTADLLIISSNPAYNATEYYPTEDWCDNDIINFFQERLNNVYYQSTVFYKHIIKYASWILSISQDDPIITQKICTVNTIHCKSSKEKDGTANCWNYCVQKWMKQILDQFNGRYILLHGSYAKKLQLICEQYNKIIFYLPHYAAHSSLTDNDKKVLIDNVKMNVSNNDLFNYNNTIIR